MKSKVDEVLMREHQFYEEDEFERDQFIVDLDVGDYITVIVYDASEKELTKKTFTAKHGNSHLNCQWQDKGLRKQLEE